jgi:hypothetical protein
MNSILKTLLVLELWLLGGCAAESEKGNPGICPLTCGKAVLGSNDPQFSAKSVLKDLRFECPRGLTQPLDLDAVLVQFLFTEKITVNGAERLRPVPFLAFEPVITGILSEYKNPDNTNPDTGQVPQRYVGVRTPKTEWCTDACGVATIELEPRCLTAGLTNEINVMIHSGPLYAVDPNKIVVVTPESN